MHDILPQALEQAGGASDDFQENGVEEKEVLKRKFSMDEALEDKICDLYDLYIEVQILVPTFTLKESLTL